MCNWIARPFQAVTRRARAASFLARWLSLKKKTTQVSFAEYHSKRNYAEKIHAVKLCQTWSIFKQYHATSGYSRLKRTQGKHGGHGRSDSWLYPLWNIWKEQLCYRGIKWKITFLMTTGYFWVKMPNKSIYHPNAVHNLCRSNNGINN